MGELYPDFNLCPSYNPENGICMYYDQIREAREISLYYNKPLVTDVLRPTLVDYRSGGCLNIILMKTIPFCSAHDIKSSGRGAVAQRQQECPANSNSVRDHRFARRIVLG